MIPLGAINLLTVAFMLVMRLQNGMEVKCIIGYYVMASAVLLFGYLTIYDLIHIDYKLEEVIMVGGTIVCMALASFVSYMFNQHRKEIIEL